MTHYQFQTEFSRYGISTDAPFHVEDPRWQGNGARNMSTRDAQQMIAALRAHNGDGIIDECRKALGLKVGEGLTDAVRDLKERNDTQASTIEYWQHGEDELNVVLGIGPDGDVVDTVRKLKIDLRALNDMTNDMHDKTVDARDTSNRIMDRLSTFGAWVNVEDGVGGVTDLLKNAREKRDELYYALKLCRDMDRTPRYEYDEPRSDGKAPSPISGQGCWWSTPREIAEIHVGVKS